MCYVIILLYRDIGSSKGVIGEIPFWGDDLQKMYSILQKKRNNPGLFALFKVYFHK